MMVDGPGLDTRAHIQLYMYLFKVPCELHFFQKWMPVSNDGSGARS